MSFNKEEFLRKVLPKAALVAVTEEAKHTIKESNISDEVISITKFPFRIGRESRVKFENGMLIIQERHKINSGYEPNNDAYLVDAGQLLQISRKHFIIEKSGDKYFLTDVGSACGTYVNDTNLGGKDNGGRCELFDGDTIKIGTYDSKYIYKFFVLDNIKVQNTLL